jgi:hypothetical protein
MGQTTFEHLNDSNVEIQSDYHQNSYHVSDVGMLKCYHEVEHEVDLARGKNTVKGS